MDEYILYISCNTGTRGNLSLHIFCFRNQVWPKISAATLFKNFMNKSKIDRIAYFPILHYFVKMTGYPCKNYVRPRLEPRKYEVYNEVAADILMQYFVPENIILNRISDLIRMLRIFITEEYFGPLFYHVIQKFGAAFGLRGIYVIKARKRGYLYWRYTLHLDCGKIGDFDIFEAKTIDFWKIRRNLKLEKVGDRKWKIIIS